MIALLRGVVAARNSDSIVVDVQGVGYQVFVPSPVIGTLALGSELCMHIHTSVREDAITLFGFTEVRHRDVFLSLTTVKGIGPKLAMAVMGGMALPDLVAAVASADIRRLTKVPGLGKKTAERIVVELRERFEPLVNEYDVTGVAGERSIPAVSLADDAKSALSNLGFKSSHIDKALTEVLESPDVPTDFDGLFREALKRLR
ncbi:MAG: Holliday junction branch migration protein RuvA [Myxococcota bacterium]|nr:Holliday junction branch migration protein RuvA [Myxococcota bacterium]